MPPFPVLQTKRLLLRELSLDDAPALFKIHGNGEAMRYFGTDPLKELHEAERLVAKFAAWREEPNPGVRWALAHRERGELLGTCGLFGWNRDWRRSLLGYELAESARGRGYMAEALRAAVAWGFAEMQLNRVEALIHPDNAPSLRLAERLGFRREGVLREVAFWGGGFHDLIQHSLLRREWDDGAADIEKQAGKEKQA